MYLAQGLLRPNISPFLILNISPFLILNIGRTDFIFFFIFPSVVTDFHPVESKFIRYNGYNPDLI